MRGAESVKTDREGEGGAKDRESQTEIEGEKERVGDKK